MEQAIVNLDLGGQEVHFGAIVVDEAQDFSLGWWYALTQSLLSESDGPLYAFMDPNQSLRGEVQWPDVEFAARFKLTINCRNTRRIAAASASVLNLEPHTFPRAPVGGALRVLRASSPPQQKGLVMQELRSLLLREDVASGQIAVIGPAAKENGSLSDLTDIDGVPIVTSAEEWRDGGGVLVTTARSFKGLEAEVGPALRSRRFWPTVPAGRSLRRVLARQGAADRGRAWGSMPQGDRRGPGSVRSRDMRLRDSVPCPTRRPSRISRRPGEAQLPGNR